MSDKLLMYVNPNFVLHIFINEVGQFIFHYSYLNPFKVQAYCLERIPAQGLFRFQDL